MSRDEAILVDIVHATEHIGLFIQGMSRVVPADGGGALLVLSANPMGCSFFRKVWLIG